MVKSMGKSITKRRVIYAILSVIMMIGIFCFSARDSEKSSKDSLEVGLVVGRTFVKNFDKLSEDKQVEYAKKIDHPVRKTAHFVEYTVLGFLLLGVFVGNGAVKLLPVFMAWLLGTVYAGTDEFHQMFSSGRSCQLSDVLLDSSGAITGVMLSAVFFSLIFLLRKRRTKEKIKKDEIRGSKGERSFC